MQRSALRRSALLLTALAALAPASAHALPAAARGIVPGPTTPVVDVDGIRGSDEGYRHIARDTDTEAPAGSDFSVDIYGACTETDTYFYVESLTPSNGVYTLNLFFDATNNDAWDGWQADRGVYVDASGVNTEPGPGRVLLEGETTWTGSAYEIRISRDFTSTYWFAYDIVSENLPRNTSWGTDNYADMVGFLPPPCVSIPEVAPDGSILFDCGAYDSDLRVGQYLLDFSLATTLQLDGICDVSLASAHGGTVTSIASAAFVVNRDGVTIESLDATAKATILGSGTQAGFYVAPGTADVTIRSLMFQTLGRPIVAQNSIRTTIGDDPGTCGPECWNVVSPFGNRIVGTGSMHEGVLALASGDASEVTVTFGETGGRTRTFQAPLTDGLIGNDLVGINIVGNYISFNPPGPITPEADVTGIVVRQRGTGRDAFGVDVKQNAVGMFSSEFPHFNYAGIRIHAESNDPNFAHIQDVYVFKNTLGRLEELNLSEQGLPDAGDVHATGRVGVTIGRVSNFEVTGNSIRTVLSKVPGINMMGGGVIVFDSFDGFIQTNSVITIAGPDTARSDLGAIGIVDNLLELIGGTVGGPSKPTRDIRVYSNYAGWSGNDAQDPPIGTQRGLVVSGASGITAWANQFKVTSEKSILIGARIEGPGAPFATIASLAPRAVTGSSFCGNWLDSFRGAPEGEPPVNAPDTPTSEITFTSGIGSSGNRFPGGHLYSGNGRC